MYKTYKENIEFLKTCDTSFVADVLAERFHLSNFSIDLPKPLNYGERFVGPALTASFRRESKNEGSVDFWTVIDKNMQEGDVFVLGDADNVLVLGDVLARYIQLKGACAVLTDGKIRDGRVNKNIGMPLFCMGLSTDITKVGSELFRVKGTLEMFGVKINVGDILLGDEDGIVVIPRELLDDIVYEVEDVAQLEEGYNVAFNKDEGLLDEIKRIGKLKHIKRSEK